MGESAPVAVLQHGMVNSSDVWLLHQEDSPALKLSEDGFDVWLANSRGSKYSREHVDFDPDSDPEFWNHSFIEMAMFDLPAVIDYVTEETKQEKVTYIAHSMGTTIGYAGIGMNPEYFIEKLNLFVQLSPVVDISNSKSMFLKYFSKSGWEIFSKTQENDFHEFFGKHWYGDFGKQVKKVFRPLSMIKKTMIPNKEWDDPVCSKILENHFPHGASVKTLTHLG